MLKSWYEKRNNYIRAREYQEEKTPLKLTLCNKIELLIAIRYYTSEDLYYTIVQDSKQIPNLKKGDNGFIRWELVNNLVPAEA